MCKRSRAVVTVAAGIAAALLLSACSGQTQSQTDAAGPAADGDLRIINVATVGIMSDVALAIADEQGYLAEEGLALETTTVANPPAGVAALQGGQLDFAFAPGVVFVNARSNGVPVKAIAGASGFPDDIAPGPELDEYDDTGVYVRPDSGLEKLTDLEGKSIAVNARKANLEATVSQALKDEGVDLDTIEWVALDFTSMLEALENGTVDAVVPVNPFTLRADDDGMVRIASPATYFFGPGPSSFWLASDDLVDNDPELVASFQRAITKANEYANGHLDESIAQGVEIAGLDIPVERAGKIYWPLEVPQESVDLIGDQLFELNFLEEKPDLNDVIVPLP